MTYRQFRLPNGSISMDILRVDGTAMSTIPSTMDNRDWCAYQVWLSEGNTPLPPEA